MDYIFKIKQMTVVSKYNLEKFTVFATHKNHSYFCVASPQSNYKIYYKELKISWVVQCHKT